MALRPFSWLKNTKRAQCMSQVRCCSWTRRGAKVLASITSCRHRGGPNYGYITFSIRQRLSQYAAGRGCSRSGSLPEAQQAPPQAGSCSTVHDRVHRLQWAFHQKALPCSTATPGPPWRQSSSAWVVHLQLGEVVHGCVPVLHQDLGGQLAPQGAQVALWVGRQGPAGQDISCHSASTGLSCPLTVRCRAAPRC